MLFLPHILHYETWDFRTRGKKWYYRQRKIEIESKTRPVNCNGNKNCIYQNDNYKVRKHSPDKIRPVSLKMCTVPAEHYDVHHNCRNHIYHAVVYYRQAGPVADNPFCSNGNQRQDGQENKVWYDHPVVGFVEGEKLPVKSVPEVGNHKETYSGLWQYGLF